MERFQEGWLRMPMIAFDHRRVLARRHPAPKDTRTGIAAYIYVTLFWPLAFVPWEKLGLD
jgi:hypothetical protein